MNINSKYCIMGFQRIANKFISYYKKAKKAKDKNAINQIKLLLSYINHNRIDRHEKSVSLISLINVISTLVLVKENHDIYGWYGVFNQSKNQTVRIFKTFDQNKSDYDEYFGKYTLFGQLLHFIESNEDTIIMNSLKETFDFDEDYDEAYYLVDLIKDVIKSSNWDSWIELW